MFKLFHCLMRAWLCLLVHDAQGFGSVSILADRSARAFLYSCGSKRLAPDQDGSRASAFQRAVSNTPADQTGAFVDCFPFRAAFPREKAGRRLHRLFRGLLKLHSRYGPLDRSAAQGSLCHEGSTRPFSQPRRSSASGSIDNSPDGTFLHR